MAVYAGRHNERGERDDPRHWLRMRVLIVEKMMIMMIGGGWSDGKACGRKEDEKGG